jgi:hypothetical protein
MRSESFTSRYDGTNDEAMTQREIDEGNTYEEVCSDEEEE